MSVDSNAAVTFIGTSNVMKSNTALLGKNIYSTSPKLKFSVCHPGDTITPKTYDGSFLSTKIEDDLDKCTCTPIENAATTATVTCTYPTDSRLDGNCITGHWKDTTGTADVCTPHTVCGNQLQTDYVLAAIIDGTKNTWDHDNSIWTDDTVYDANGEKKTSAFNTLKSNAIRVSFEHGSCIQQFDYEHNLDMTLAEIFNSGEQIGKSPGRSEWIRLGCGDFVTQYNW